MPLLKAQRVCTDDAPCRIYDPCDRCMAVQVLTEEDWRLIQFYSSVSEQYINQAPMGTSGAPILTPRLEGYEAALRLGQYPEAEWPWLIQGATLLHRLVHKIEEVEWRKEIPRLRRVRGHPLGHIRPEDVS